MKILENSGNEYLRRINEIIKILKKNDFGYLIEEKTKLPKFPLLRNNKNEFFEEVEDNVPMRIRMVFEQLGPTFIKLGQMLSSRPDLIGLDIAKELEKLTDDTPALPFDEMKKVIEEELNGNIEDVFESIDETPLGSASLAQVYKAVLKENNEEVAIKVLRPKTEETVEIDLKIMKFLAEKSQKYISATKTFNFEGIVSEFTRSINKEIDFIEEMNNMQHLAHNFRKNKFIHIPEVYSKYTSKRLLVMEFIKGIPMTALMNDDEIEGINKELIAKRGVNAYFKQIFIDGFFHADPHPGNLIIMEDNVVCFIDLGKMGNLTEEFRKDLAYLLLSLNSGDTSNILNQLEYMDVITSKQITVELKDDLNDLINRYYKTDINHFDGILQNLFKIMIKHKIQFPKEFMNIGIGISLIQNMGTSLYPSFNPEIELTKMSKKIIIQRYYPKRIVNDVLNLTRELEHLTSHLPDRINSIMTKIEDGEITIKLEVLYINKLIDKISYALIVSSLIIGSSLIVLADMEPKYHGMPILGVFGFLLSAILGFYLVIRYLDRFIKE